MDNRKLNKANKSFAKLRLSARGQSGDLIKFHYLLSQYKAKVFEQHAHLFL